MDKAPQRYDPQLKVEAYLASPDRRNDLPGERFAPTFSPSETGAVASPMPDGMAVWYVIVDEIIESEATFEAWPWPTLEPTTGHLRFDLEAAVRETVHVDRLRNVISKDRTGPAADRRIRIGDTFWVRSATVQDPGQWQVAEDVTAWARAKAKAALFAMATPDRQLDDEARMEEAERSIVDLQPEQTGRGGAHADLR